MVLDAVELSRVLDVVLISKLGPTLLASEALRVEALPIQENPVEVREKRRRRREGEKERGR